LVTFAAVFAGILLSCVAALYLFTSLIQCIKVRGQRHFRGCHQQEHAGSETLQQQNVCRAFGVKSMATGIMKFTYKLTTCLQLVGQQEGHPACKKTEWWGAGVSICLE